MPYDGQGAVSGLDMPHNLEAEQGLLGALLFDNRALESIGDALRPEHFFHDANGRIFGAIQSLAASGLSASPVTLKNHFERDSGLEKVGGAAYLAELAASVVTVINAREYARIVLDLARRRAIIDASLTTIDDARTVVHERGAGLILSEAEERLYRVAQHAAEENGPQAMPGAVEATLEMIQAAQNGQNTGTPSGIAALDRINNGFRPGGLHLVAGRPAMGKSAFALSVAHNAAESGVPVLYFSLEMSREETVQRLIARHTGISTGQQLRAGGLDEGRGDWRRLIEAQQKISRLPIFIDDSSGLSAAQIRSRARRHKRRHGLGQIVIDYLGLMTLPDRYASKVDQLGEVTRALKVMARDLEVPVILLHQLSRAVEGRDNKRPQLSDLRDSGNIEQDADTVTFLYREEYYLEREEPQRRERDSDSKYEDRMNDYRSRLAMAAGVAELIVAKFRQGRTGTARYRFDGTRQMFCDLERG